ncbi:hypothetical protein ABZT45_25495 [Streptomyces sp. NPDC005356]|uniref:hypothetical protein n=1 Tax=Streptomyces sp. NPDC005356 TaxID=3157167 RepID=UPI0033B296EE
MAAPRRSRARFLARLGPLTPYAHRPRSEHEKPSMGLSPKVVGEILTVLRRLREEEALSMVLVEQNAALTFGVADHCLVMENGEVAMEGPSARLGNDPQVRRVYLGL